MLKFKVGFLHKAAPFTKRFSACGDDHFRLFPIFRNGLITMDKAVPVNSLPVKKNPSILHIAEQWGHPLQASHGNFRQLPPYTESACHMLPCSLVCEGFWFFRDDSAFHPYER